ncbi:MAG TPA: hypothetical protein VNF72_11575 [Myxococcota bacterium]|nr:hypothetical protein [Myxococcota bacterium]
MQGDFWGAFYHSDLQSLWLPMLIPFLFLLYLVSGGRPAGPTRVRFLHVWALLFTVETLIDPIATGPLTRALHFDGVALYAWIFVFVWLGDFRVLWLHFADAGDAPDPRGAARPAAALACLVPVTTGALYAPVWMGFVEAPSQVLWLIYEVLFFALALWLRARTANPALRAIWLYVLAYYALWASADVLILFGVDLGWALRVLPNQLYYAFFVPFVWWRARGSSREVEAGISGRARPA